MWFLVPQLISPRQALGTEVPKAVETHGKLLAYKVMTAMRAGSGDDTDVPEGGNCDLWLNVKILKGSVILPAASAHRS